MIPSSLERPRRHAVILSFGIWHIGGTAPDLHSQTGTIWEFGPSRFLVSWNDFPLDEGAPMNFSAQGFLLGEFLLRELGVNALDSNPQISHKFWTGVHKMINVSGTRLFHVRSNNLGSNNPRVERCWNFLFSGENHPLKTRLGSGRTPRFPILTGRIGRRGHEGVPKESGS